MDPVQPHEILRGPAERTFEIRGRVYRSVAVSTARNECESCAFQLSPPVRCALGVHLGCYLRVGELLGPTCMAQRAGYEEVFTGHRCSVTGDTFSAEDAWKATRELCG